MAPYVLCFVYLWNNGKLRTLCSGVCFRRSFCASRLHFRDLKRITRTYPPRAQVPAWFEQDSSAGLCSRLERNKRRDDDHHGTWLKSSGPLKSSFAHRHRAASNHFIWFAIRFPVTIWYIARNLRYRKVGFFKLLNNTYIANTANNW